MLAIIDGDVLCYQACKPRYEKKARIDYQNNISYVQLDVEGNRQSFEFTEKEDQEYLEESWDNFNTLLQEILEVNYAQDYLMGVKGDNNFRHLMYPEYKMNRHADPSKMNKFVPFLRRMAVTFDMAVAAHGFEADDLIRIWAKEAKQSEQEFVICSIDKDLLCIPGKHYLMHKKTHISISEHEALRNYYIQLLKGDPTDNIPGVPKVGDIKAFKILEDCKDEQEMQEAVVANYLNAYGDDWLSWLLSNGKMIHLSQNVGDYFKVMDWEVVREII